MTPPSPRLAIIGGGPAGLMAAEAAAASGGAASDREIRIDLFDAMPSVGRKFLMAGKSGLNLTHSEPFEQFLGRYHPYHQRLGPILTAFDATAIRDWVRGLGIETFVGSSGQVFPTDFKAAPLLRAWIRRLKLAGVRFHARHRWMGWDTEGRLSFETAGGPARIAADATILALGGASWPQLGSDGAWAPRLAARGVTITPLEPANCGFDIAWSDHFRKRFAGEPVKSVAITSEAGHRRGEFVVTRTGIEGAGIYPHAAALRRRLAAESQATLSIDLLPDRKPEVVRAALGQFRGSRSLAEHLRRTLGLTGVKAGLLREVLSADALSDNRRLAAAVKALPVTLLATRPLAEAISTAGGIAWEGVTEELMLNALPGVFAAGEMLDWEVSTGGYLLTACFATGRWAGLAAARRLTAGISPEPL